ncbi:MAG: type II toxin-antitoxin system RelE/ParE family toxin [Massilia sp.]
MKLLIDELASAELESIATYYAQVANKELARTFVDEFERAAYLVLGNPHIGSALRGGQRKYSLRRFPYQIIYQLAGNDLRILALAHHRRKPGYWKKLP